MISRERVIRTIRHQKADRIPVYGWLRENLSRQLTDRFGSVEHFEDLYQFDYAHLFGGPYPYWGNCMEELRAVHGGTIEPSHLLEVSMPDVNDSAAYQTIIDGVKHHKEQRGRFVYAQTCGIFEILNDPFGIQNHLLYLLMYEDDLHKVYQRQAQWNIQFIHNCLDLGVDMIHVSDDWGSQSSMLFDPDLWERLIYPYHKLMADVVKKRKAFLSLHSDGYIMPVLDRIIALGYDVIHPWQESAGMDLSVFKKHYADRIVVMGGLDIQSVLGHGDIGRVRQEIDRVTNMFSDGGLLFCTSHFVQDHCSIDELVAAYDHVRRCVDNPQHPSETI